MSDSLILRELPARRAEIAAGRRITAADISDWCDRLQPAREALLPAESEEMLRVLTREGNLTEVLAPRWLHHLLGLPHACAHGLLDYHHPKLGKVYLIQVRHWTKSDSPGHLDISFAGHLKGLQSVEKASEEEMFEEIGLTEEALENGLELYNRYFYEEPEGRNFWNCEWVTLYRGTVKAGALDAINFEDGEVAGLFLCPDAEMAQLKTGGLPVAAGLAGYLELLWNHSPSK